MKSTKLPRVHLIRTKTIESPIVLYFLNEKVFTQCPYCKGPCSLPVGRVSSFICTGHVGLDYLYLREEQGDLIEVDCVNCINEINRQLINIVGILCIVVGSIENYNIFIVINDLGNGKYKIGTISGTQKAKNNITINFNRQIKRILNLKAFW